MYDFSLFLLADLNIITSLYVAVKQCPVSRVTLLVILFSISIWPSVPRFQMRRLRIVSFELLVAELTRQLFALDIVLNNDYDSVTKWTLDVENSSVKF